MARVLMFSSGLDSFILKEVYKFKNDECLYIDTQTEESQNEINLVQRNFPGVRIITFPLVQWELENKIIPFRNNIMAFIGAQYANEIFFAFTLGDTTKDKDYIFKAQMEGMLNYFHLDKDKIASLIDKNLPYIIQMPFKHMTKTEMVALYLDQGGSIYGLLTKSRSCYAALELSCGKCRSCIRRYVALKLNGIDQRNCYLSDPSGYLSSAFQEAIIKGRKKESEEIKRCMMLK